jgi:hypothetical protein
MTTVDEFQENQIAEPRCLAPAPGSEDPDGTNYPAWRLGPAQISPTFDLGMPNLERKIQALGRPWTDADRHAGWGQVLAVLWR